MRKTELTNCTQWLLDADTANEDVVIDDGIVIWRGGDFRGGDFRGGDFRGGDFLGGNFLGGNFWGEKITSAPLSIFGLRWPITIGGTQMHIGCERHKLDEWTEFDDATITKMDRGALKFWRTHKDILLALAKALPR